MALHFRFLIGVATWTGDGRLAPTPKSSRRRARVRAFQSVQAVIRRLFRVREFVLAQPAATELLDNLERTLKDALPHYRERGRSQLIVAFGCTGGRHRSVAMAKEMAARLERLDGVDVEFTPRDLGV